jgi:outer membrane lipoprotein-sorting protein
MGDLGEALAAMNGAHRSFRTLRATVYRRYDARLGDAAYARHMRSLPGDGQGLEASLAEPERTPEASVRTETVRLSVERPERFREEHLAGNFSGPSLRILNGSSWWTHDSESGAESNQDEPEVGSGIGDDWLPLLDPAGLIGACSFEPLGRAALAGREAIVLRATPLGEEFHPFAFHQLGLGADAYELAADVERGVLLRSLAFLGGEEFNRIEVREVTFDEELPPGTFALTLPPGEQLGRAAGGPQADAVTLAEAARRVPFVLWYPRDIAKGWLSEIDYFPGDERLREPPTVAVHLRREDGPHSLTIVERASGADADDDPEWGEAWARLERAGEVLEVATPPQPQRYKRVRLEREGTVITIASADFPLDSLLELALRLSPLSERS